MTMLSSLRSSAGSVIRRYTIQQSRTTAGSGVLVASLSTTPRQCSGWLSASIAPYQSSSTARADLSPDYEIRRRYSADRSSSSASASSSLPSSSSSSNSSMFTSTNGSKDTTNDWMDVLDDAAEAQEAIRAFKEDGLVLGISNRDGLINLVE
ncbi:hypothetical protein BDF22DRAFT_742107 [Syncephalis plumigaleata]|nr:hypothetical protein BDF22DRAFT_742107 [Syncephalis plumigaleata]